VFLLDCGDDVIHSRPTDSPGDVAVMLAVDALAALPLFTGGFVVPLALPG